MRETLYIRLREPAEEALTAYALVSSDGLGAAPSVFVREAPLREVLAQAAGRKRVVFVPGGAVRLTQVKVPARQPAKVLQAAPFMLEEQFAEDVETLHFALGPRQPDGSFPIAAVAHEHMEAWLAPFRAHQALPDLMVPETLALPWENEGPWAVLAEPDHLTARTGAFAGFSCAPDDFELFLQLAEEGRPHPLRVLVARGSQEDYTRLQRPLELLPGFGHPLEAMVRHLQPELAINLLQSGYSQRESLERLWRPWRFAAGLAAAAFVLGIVLNTAEGLHCSHAAAKQKTSNEQRFNQLFPGQRVQSISLSTQVDQEAQMLRGGNGQGSLFVLLQQAADSLAATPGLTLNAMEYREGALFLELDGKDLQTLEQLRNWFGAHHAATLEVQGADASSSGAKIRLKLSAAKASS